MIKLTGEFVLIEELPVEEKTSGGIFIPGGTKDDAIRGKVIEIGPGEKRKKDGRIKPTTLKVGDNILFDEKRTYALKLKGKPYFLIKERHVIGLIENACKTQ